MKEVSRGSSELYKPTFDVQRQLLDGPFDPALPAEKSMVYYLFIAGHTTRSDPELSLCSPNAVAAAVVHIRDSGPVLVAFTMCKYFTNCNSTRNIKALDLFTVLSSSADDDGPSRVYAGELRGIGGTGEFD